MLLKAQRQNQKSEKMRQIRFRGKLVDGGRWVEGSLLTFPDGEQYICYQTEGSTQELRKDPVRRDTVGQYTGVNDNAGVPVFEGDVIQNGDKGFFYVVEWNQDGWAAKQVGRSSFIDLYYWRKDLSVKGNRFDNPELLEVKKPEPPKNGLLEGEFRIRALYENGCMSKKGHVYVAQYVGKGRNKKVRVWDESSKLDEEYKHRYGSCCDMELSIFGDDRVEPIYEIIEE
jgi:uncharacterized phage protein (TIGR01671 family)